MPHKTMRRILSVLFTMISVALIFFSISCTKETPATTTKQPIRFADAGWDSIQVHDRIVGFIAEHGYGYPASEYIPCQTITQWVGLEQGEMDINMECWVESMQETYDKYMATGKLENLGANFPDSWQGWLVPTYVIKGDPARGIKALAPDLKSVFDMAKYWQLFKDREDPTKGRFYSCIPGWVCQETNEWKMHCYGLDKYYNIFLPGTDMALSTSLIAAYEKGEPWFGYYWEPTWVLGKLDMTKLEEPPFDQKVWDEQKRCCAYMPVRTDIIVTKDFMARAPDIVAFLRNYETNGEINNRVLSYMRDSKADTAQAAIWFLKEYESLWTGWVPADVAQKIKAALP